MNLVGTNLLIHMIFSRDYPSPYPSELFDICCLFFNHFTLNILILLKKFYIQIDTKYFNWCVDHILKLLYRKNKTVHSYFICRFSIKHKYHCNSNETNTISIRFIILKFPIEKKIVKGSGFCNQKIEVFGFFFQSILLYQKQHIYMLQQYNKYLHTKYMHVSKVIHLVITHLSFMIFKLQNCNLYTCTSNLIRHLGRNILPPCG